MDCPARYVPNLGFGQLACEYRDGLMRGCAENNPAFLCQHILRQPLHQIRLARASMSCKEIETAGLISGLYLTERLCLVRSKVSVG